MRSFTLLYQLEAESNVMDSSRIGTRFDKRFALTRADKKLKKKAGGEGKKGSKGAEGAMETKSIKVEGSASGDCVLVKLKRTVHTHGRARARARKQTGMEHAQTHKHQLKRFAKVKQVFSLRNFPLDFHVLTLNFEPKKVTIDRCMQLIALGQGSIMRACRDAQKVKTKTSGYKESLMWKLRRKASTSNAENALFMFNTQPIRVKVLKSFEEEQCVISKLKSQTCRYPFMSNRAATFRDFFFDTRLDDGAFEHKHVRVRTHAADMRMRSFGLHVDALARTTQVTATSPHSPRGR